MWTALLLTLTFLACVLKSAISANPALGHFNINPDTITVSGLSSGAFMAVQMHVAFSKNIAGAAVFAGGPYYCAEGDLNNAQYKCMSTLMGKPNVQTFVNDTNKFFAANQIDDPANLADDSVFLFSGTQDSTVSPVVMQVLEDYYKSFIKTGTISSEFSFKAAHTLPTVDYGGTCTVTASPYIGKCAYDGAGIALKALYGSDLMPGKDVAANLVAFDQSPFVPAKSSLGTTGYVYVPTACKGGAKQCHLHVSFHGCKQDIASIQNQYAANTGFNSWAEANNIIVLYPYAVSSVTPSNPNSCWDWWGYSGTNYVYKSGVQMKFAKDLIDEIMKGSAPVPTTAPTPTGPPVPPVPTLSPTAPAPTADPTAKPTSGFVCQEWTACVWDHYSAGRAVFSTNYLNYWAKGSNDDLGSTSYCGGAVGNTSPVPVRMVADKYYEKGNCVVGK